MKRPVRESVVVDVEYESDSGPVGPSHGHLSDPLL
jgi:hypothetical protein